MKVKQFYGISTQVEYLDKAKEAWNGRKFGKYLKNKLQARAVSISSTAIDVLWAAGYPAATVVATIGGGLWILAEASTGDKIAARVHAKMLVKSLPFPIIKIGQIPPQLIGLVSPELEVALHKKIAHRRWEKNYGDHYVFMNAKRKYS